MSIGCRDGGIRYLDVKAVFGSAIFQACFLAFKQRVRSPADDEVKDVQDGVVRFADRRAQVDAWNVQAAERQAKLDAFSARWPTDASLPVRGMVRQISDTELHFEGLISTDVEGADGRSFCDRESGQTFLAEPGTSVWWMFDEVSCDGMSIDHIDFHIPVS